MPNATFKQKAHAISESLGNKGLICREECDDCNQRFNQTIEQDVTRFFQFFLILNGVKGKNGSPTLQGNGISITNNPSSRSTLGRDTLVLKVKTMPDTRDIQEITKFVSDQFSFSNVKYVPQNIYKCFCKYVLSLPNVRCPGHLGFEIYENDKLIGFTYDREFVDETVYEYDYIPKYNIVAYDRLLIPSNPSEYKSPAKLR